MGMATVPPQRRVDSHLVQPTPHRRAATAHRPGDRRPRYATTGSATGRILRAQVVSDNYQLREQPPTEPTRPPRWIPIPGTRQFREVQAATGVFRDDTRPTHLSPGEDVIRECGVLVDLDLDDVPPIPVRPALIPAAVSAHGRDVWIVDRELPVVIRLREQRVVGEYRLPGAILTEFAHRPRWVEADARDAGFSGGTGSSAAISTARQSASTSTWLPVLPQFRAHCCPGTAPTSRA